MPRPIARPIVCAIACVMALPALTACGPRSFGADNPTDAPGVNLRKDAEDGVEVGNRLIAAGEYELAIDAFTRAALDQGLTGQIMMGMGSANLGLGRLGQAEDALRQAVAKEPNWPEALNNLGVVLVERGKTAEATHIFRKAYALDNGESDAIRENLRSTLAKVENDANIAPIENDYKLVRRGSSDFLIRPNL